jgi:hypothetical protein
VIAGLAPGVHVAAPLPARAEISAAMDVAGFIGIATKGPVGTAVAIEGWPQFVATFGGFLPNAMLAYAVRGFFDNGGGRCHIVRAAAPEWLTKTAGVQPVDGRASSVADAGSIRAGAVVTMVQEPATVAAGAQPADRLASIVADARGFYPGAPVTIRQAGAAAVFATVRTVDLPTNTIGWQAALPTALDLTLPFTVTTRHFDERLVADVLGTTISWTLPIDPRFDLTLPIDFAAGAGAATADIADEAGQPLLRVTATSPGRWGNALAVRVTTALSAETRTRLRPTPDAPGMLTLERVIGLRAGSTISVMQDGVAHVRRQIKGVDIANRQIELDAALVGFDLPHAADGTKPISLRRLSFALSVTENDRLLESFIDLDLPMAATPQLAPVNDASRLIVVERLPGAGYPFPDPASGLLRFGRAQLIGGRDGIAMLRVADLIGRGDSAERLGLRQFESEDEPAALAIPDAVLPAMPAVVRAPLEPTTPDPCDLCAPPPLVPPPTPPAVMIEATPAFAPDDVRAIQMALIEHCELRGDRVALIDPPLARGTADPFDVEALTVWRQQFDSSYAVAYFPWTSVIDPIAGLPGATRDIPFCGHALGQFALADAEPGRPAPANRLVQWTALLPRPLDDAEHGGLNVIGINCVRIQPARGIRIMGARTLSGDPAWQQLTVRRLVIRLKRLLARALRWAVFEPNDRTLVNNIIAQIEGFLESEWIAQRLTGATIAEAFYVRPISLADDVDNGRLILEIGVVPSVPAEFVILRLTRSEDRLDVAELPAGGWPS